MTNSLRLLFSLLLVAACTSSNGTPPAGSLGRECRPPDGTCDPGLICYLETCIQSQHDPLDAGVDDAGYGAHASGPIRMAALTNGVFLTERGFLIVDVRAARLVARDGRELRRVEEAGGAASAFDGEHLFVVQRDGDMVFLHRYTADLDAVGEPFPIPSICKFRLFALGSGWGLCHGAEDVAVLDFETGAVSTASFESFGDVILGAERGVFATYQFVASDIDGFETNVYRISEAGEIRWVASRFDPEEPGDRYGHWLRQKDGELIGTRAERIDIGSPRCLAEGADFVYEGWVIVDSAPVSTGRFSVSSTDGTHTEEVALAAGAEAAAMYVLTIEPAVGDDPAPAETHVIAGTFAAGMATLGAEHPAALGADFTTATGEFILATPSNMNATPTQGIWFLAPGETPSASLNLPELPEGWAYEGWVVGEDGPISTGTFTDVAAADSDGGGAAAGPDATPPFPGQDFVDPATDLSVGHMAVISIEPSPDDSPMPFQFKPLGGPIGTATMPDTQELGNIFAGNNHRNGGHRVVLWSPSDWKRPALIECRAFSFSRGI